MIAIQSMGNIMHNINFMQCMARFLITTKVAINEITIYINYSCHMATVPDQPAYQLILQLIYIHCCEYFALFTKIGK